MVGDCGESVANGGMGGGGEERCAQGLPDEPIMFSCDQKGVYYNEAESKELGTLALTGDDAVDLKTNHGQSRSRISLFTMVSTDPLQEPPIEILFKVKTDRTLPTDLPVDVRMSLAFSDSGSYREEHVLQYLRRWLPVWTPEREKNHDYRILLLDAYTAHKTEAVRALCRERGFIRIMYGGGVTGILQWNDTDLHAQLDQLYLDLEYEDFQLQLERRPWRVPARSKQSVVDDVAAIWAHLPHAGIGIGASKRTGLGISLPRFSEDGRCSLSASEDSRVTRDAEEFWTMNKIPELRKNALQEVHDEWRAGKIRSFWDIEAFLQDFPDGDDGEKIEGHESSYTHTPASRHSPPITRQPLHRFIHNPSMTGCE